MNDSSSLLDWLDRAWRDAGGAIESEPSQQGPAPHRRLIAARVQHRRGDSPLNGRDLASLVRAVALWEQSRNGPGYGTRVPIDVVESIDPAFLNDAALTVLRREGAYAWVGAREWRPPWLISGDGVGPEAGLYDGQARRNDPREPPDPPLLTFGWGSYHSRAQRSSVRTVLSAPPGSTVIVNFPTGSGKSLCFLLPSLMPLPDESGLRGVTPIVVPTVALALDLEKRVRSRVEHATAYRPGSPEADNIAARIRAGIQGPVFVAPESLTGALQLPFMDAARSGFLKYFVVDEAHMITAWGDDFRPAFQHIAALRNELLRASKIPFITLLMSATLTGYSLRALFDLFRHPGPVKQVHAVRLRPEPAYWLRKARNEDERRGFVCEAVHHLPRPLILYVTRRAHAVAWRDRLVELGYRRVGMMHGDTDDDTRARLLRDWDSDALDIMVATSAFGLGVDKPDVRSVIHATCPEDIDRFYQDVGRTGRDGHSSISLMVWTDADVKTARSLAIPTFIGIERGRERWDAMFASKERSALDGFHFDVPLDVSPDIDMENDENERWNLRTLLLMSRAGMIDVHGTRITQSRRWVTVGIEAEGLLEPKQWETKVEPLRTDLLESNRKAWDGLQELLEAKTCFAKSFKQAYSVDAYDVNVVEACGGCPQCRAQGTAPHCGHLFARTEDPKPWPSAPVGAELRGWLSKSSTGFIFFDPRDAHDLVPTLAPVVEWACAQGIRNIIVRNEYRETWTAVLRPLGRRPLFVSDTIPRGVEQAQATLVLATGTFHREWSSEWAAALALNSVTIFALPHDSRDPTDPRRLLVETALRIPHLSIAEWREQYLV
ncbi:protein DpdF [Anaeromyxobacter paludicola]|uniref:DEAD/DEAH box helicase domain protein n=1 Tax=Anaeromyxobacter paludicola TaxID=2918171 RepID=A0ABN6N6H0_9BACT|nr:protein DpdF [Anaeromyxobacter paludicola]BDG08611.1 hypothetical protein AMPC_17240 [Anaeromyxobacter paludicola]